MTSVTSASFPDGDWIGHCYECYIRRLNRISSRLALTSYLVLHDAKIPKTEVQKCRESPMG